MHTIQIWERRSVQNSLPSSSFQENPWYKTEKNWKTNPLGQKISNREIEQDNKANTCNMLERERERKSQNLKPLYLQRWRRINHWWQRGKIPPATLSKSERQSSEEFVDLGLLGYMYFFVIFLLLFILKLKMLRDKVQRHQRGWQKLYFLKARGG